MSTTSDKAESHVDIDRHHHNGQSAGAAAQEASRGKDAEATLKPPAPYAEDVADDEESAGGAVVRSIGKARQVASTSAHPLRHGRDEHAAAMAAAAAAAATEQDEDEARSLETQMRLAKGHRDAMNAVMELAQASQVVSAASAGMAAPQDAQAKGGAREKRKRNGPLNEKAAANGSANDSDNKASRTASDAAAALQSVQGQFTPAQWRNWSAETQENFVKLFGRALDEGSPLKRAQAEKAVENIDTRDTRTADRAHETPSEPRPSEEQQAEPTDAEAEAEHAALVARNGRSLNPSKRAAQNRAAQRAFRLRRDEHVRVVELKARERDDAVQSAEQLRLRLEDAMETVDALRADNKSLRLAIEAMGGRAPTPPSRVLQNDHADDAEASESRADAAAASAEQPGPPADASQATDDRTTSDKISDAQTGTQNQLGGLSAVAAAAAAAAAMGSSNTVGDQETTS